MSRVLQKPRWVKRAGKMILRVAAAGVPAETVLTLIYAALIAFAVWAVKTGR